jgi:hypothetical protein
LPDALADALPVPLPAVEPPVELLPGELEPEELVVFVLFAGGHVKSNLGVDDKLAVISNCSTFAVLPSTRAYHQVFVFPKSMSQPMLSQYPFALSVEAMA